jgi:hypothetical protein
MLPNLAQLKKLYREGYNITDLLKAAQGENLNSSEIIEIAYDLQAGSYIELYHQNPILTAEYTSIVVDILRPWVSPSSSVLDVGTGEMTTFGPVMSQLTYAAGFACDLSLSRLLAGRNWLQHHFPSVFQSLHLCVADLVALPFADASMDIIWSSHALEPNHGREKLLISELLRVAAKKLILFEPHYESASPEAQQRMERLGYVRNLEATIAECGGELVDLVKLPLAANPLNQTHCFIVHPLDHPASNPPANRIPEFVCPGGMDPLDVHADGCILSSSGLLAYPLVCGIPLLRNHLAFPFTHPELITSIPSQEGSVLMPSTSGDQ